MKMFGVPLVNECFKSWYLRKTATWTEKFWLLSVFLRKSKWQTLVGGSQDWWFFSKKNGPYHIWRPVEHFWADFGHFEEIIDFRAPPVATKIIFMKTQTNTYFLPPPNRVCQNMAYRPLKSFSTVRISEETTDKFPSKFSSFSVKKLSLVSSDILTAEKLFSGL